MLRISKLTDYATVILARLAAEPERRFTAAQIAAETHLAAPTVSKLLKQLHRQGLVVSTRGSAGGYLSRDRPPRSAPRRSSMRWTGRWHSRSVPAPRATAASSAPVASAIPGSA